jgi:cyclophilin family peptidyl-prolyl cis-trans isomerase/HEAT repeat protein
MQWARWLVVFTATLVACASPRNAAATKELDEVRALGRRAWPEEGAEVTRALLAQLFAPDANVRAEAAFALGVRGDPSAGDKLVFVALDHHEADRDALVRARAIEALSKLDRPDLHERVLEALDDPDPRVRLEAAQGAGRWPAQPGVVNQRLIRALATEKVVSVQTYVLYALERRKSEEALDAFVRFASSSDAEQRIFAVRGLRASIEAPAARDAAVRALGDADWRVAYEATQSLGASRAQEAAVALLEARSHVNPHVRRGAFEALAVWSKSLEDGARFNARDTHLAGALWSDSVAATLRSEPSSSVRAALLTCVVPLWGWMGGDAAEFRAAEMVMREAEFETVARNDVEWIGVARGLAASRHRDCVDVLIELAQRPDLALRGAALEALAQHKSEVTHAFLIKQLADADLGIRMAAVLSLTEMLEDADLDALARCFETSRGEGGPEVRFNIVKLLAKFGARATPLLTLAARDEHPFVRRTARSELEQLGMSAAELDALAAQVAAPPQRPPAPLRFERRPRMKLVTSRGELVFELFSDEAPEHVANLVELARRDHYDGLTFHRVVPDFVVQGGCFRGDGNGGGTWRGREDELPHEISPRKYVRGSLGMPRWDYVNSGGSQFFVAHRATPHLDGRYTIFGELREGFDVLDQLEVGDTIVDVVISE